MTLEQFYSADERRRTSPEWDYGVMWVADDGDRWPHWRVSWIIVTGELYAYRQDNKQTVEVLGVVPAKGDYYGNEWRGFAEAQEAPGGIDAVMKGWANGKPHKPLQWVRDRVAEHAEAVTRV